MTAATTRDTRFDRRIAFLLTLRSRYSIRRWNPLFDSKPFAHFVRTHSEAIDAYFKFMNYR